MSNPVKFIRSGSTGASQKASHSHSHGGGIEHTHEAMERPGDFVSRPRAQRRKDFGDRAFTVGIGGPVGSGKTALTLQLCRLLRDKVELCVVTNDIFTREDWEFLVKNEALPADRMRAVETGGCPHAAIREDYSTNMEAIKELTREFHPDMVIVESGGDNLAANFSTELADFIIYCIDVAGGDKIPRKGGPGITESDLLVINKTDLAEAVGADLTVMSREAGVMRSQGPTLFTQARHNVGVAEVADLILESFKCSTAD